MLTLTLPALDAHPAHPPELRPAAVGAWLDNIATRDPADAAQVAADALAATNRVAMSDGRRLVLAERYWSTARGLWPLLERRFSQMPHPLTGEALEAAKAALSLSQELSVAYKHLLTREANRRLLMGGTRQLSALIKRSLQSISRTITNSYLAYSPIPAKTWLDAHRIYAFARTRNLHQQPLAPEEPHDTPERMYVQVLLLALANPYGFMPGQLHTVVRYLQSHSHWAKITDVQPVHRMAKAVAIIPVGHDFPPFSANKGGAVEGEKMFLLTFDLAFQLQEQLRGLEAGAQAPAGIGRDSASRRAYIGLLKRLLRQWAIPPARQFNRLPSRARVSTCAGLADIWQQSHRLETREIRAATTQAFDPVMTESSSRVAVRTATRATTQAFDPAMTECHVINHTPSGYALRQTEGQSAPLRIGELIAITAEGRAATLQVAIVRWFRNTLKGSGLEFGCELLSDDPQTAMAAPEERSESALLRAIVLPQDLSGPEDDAEPMQVLLPADRYRAEQAIRLDCGGKSGFAVLTKLIEQGPDFELYDVVPVG